MNKLLFLLFILLFQSCIIYNDVKNRTNEPICKLHDERLHKTIVRTTYGFISSVQKDNRFPNAKYRKSFGCVKPSNFFAIIYYCKTCNKLKKNEKGSANL